MVDRRSLLVLIRLGAFSSPPCPAQPALADQIYWAAADLLPAADRRRTALEPLEEELAHLVNRHLDVVEWPPEVIVADELAHLGFYIGGADSHRGGSTRRSPAGGVCRPRSCARCGTPTWTPAGGFASRPPCCGGGKTVQPRTVGLDQLVPS